MSAFLLAIAVIAAAFLAAFAALMLFGLFDRRRTSQLRRFSESERDAIVFLFENDTLLDATPAARQFLDTAPRTDGVWSHLAELLGPRFPRLTDRMKDLADLGELNLRSTDGTSRIKAEWHDGVARITLEAETAETDISGLDQHSYIAMIQELDSLRAMANHTPYALWRETAAGSITWCNAPYLTLADTLSETGEISSWPPARVFETGDETLIKTADGALPALHRVAIAPAGDDTRHWFEVSIAELPGGDRFCTALPADRLVQAESSHKEFVTTLTKTFAALPIGLAIFDRSRELALFNPALMDLTVLPADFLISKPSLSSFLDKLREARMIPEPKDYKSWRQQMSDLVAAAQNGSYEETWSLPTGQTFRVTGRPHPGGAIALLFEDISAEISVSRRFRTEIETSQAVLDALPQAVAVFTPGGILSITNLAYAQLWGRDPSTSLEDITLADTLLAWQSACAPNPVWDHVRSFATRSGARQPWNARVTMLDGRGIGCTVTPLSGGATMVAFSTTTDAMGAITEQVDRVEAKLEIHASL